MAISRLTLAYGRPGSFVFDVAAGTATVRPPAPFSGHATYKRRPHARDLWRSTLRALLLGAPPLVLHGPRYRAMLTDEFTDE